MTNDILSNLDIDRLMVNYPKFRGTYAKDQLPKNLKSKESIVVNLDDSGNPGTHWCGLMTVNSKLSYYFDPFGVPPPISVEKLGKKNGKKMLYSTAQLQGITSERCGWYCVELLSSLYRGQTIEEALDDYTRGPSKHNEKTAKKLK